MGSLSLGASTYPYLYQCSLGETLERIREMGFQKLELTAYPPQISPREVSPARQRELRRKIELLGLDLVSAQPTYQDLNFASANLGIRDEIRRQLKEYMELAAELGARIFVANPGRRNPLLMAPWQEAWQLAKEMILFCAEEAGNLGLTLAIENVPRAFMETAESVVQMVNEINLPNVGILLDVSNANVIESPIQALERTKEHIVLVHIADNDGRRWTKSPIGLGNIDFAAIAKKLQEIGYIGTCILELSPTKDTGRTLTEAKEHLGRFGWSA